MSEINVKGPTDALQAAMPQAGDIVSKLQKYLAGRGVPAKKAAKLLADAVDDYMAEEATEESDAADDLLDQLREGGIAGKTPEQLAQALADLLDSGPRSGATRLEAFLRERVDQRLAPPE